MVKGTEKKKCEKYKMSVENLIYDKIINRDSTVYHLFKVNFESCLHWKNRRWKETKYEKGMNERGQRREALREREKEEGEGKEFEMRLKREM